MYIYICINIYICCAVPLTYPPLVHMVCTTYAGYMYAYVVDMRRGSTATHTATHTIDCNTHCDTHDRLQHTLQHTRSTATHTATHTVHP